MGYSTVAEVEAILREPAANETEVTTAITDADTWIDTALKRHESTLPLSSVPAAINKASKYYAANLWLLLASDKEFSRLQGAIYERIAKSYLESYIVETYYVGKMRSG